MTEDNINIERIAELEIELEKTKANRNRVGVVERSKYLPQIAKLKGIAHKMEIALRAATECIESNKRHLEIMGRNCTVGTGQVLNEIANVLRLPDPTLSDAVVRAQNGVWCPENDRLKKALALARQHLASEFGDENWRIRQVDKLTNAKA